MSVTNTRWKVFPMFHVHFAGDREMIVAESKNLEFSNGPEREI